MNQVKCQQHFVVIKLRYNSSYFIQSSLILIHVHHVYREQKYKDLLVVTFATNEERNLLVEFCLKKQLGMEAFTLIYLSVSVTVRLK